MAPKDWIRRAVSTSRWGSMANGTSFGRVLGGKDAVGQTAERIRNCLSLYLKESNGLSPPEMWDVNGCSFSIGMLSPCSRKEATNVVRTEWSQQCKGVVLGDVGMPALWGWWAEMQGQRVDGRRKLDCLGEMFSFLMTENSECRQNTDAR